MRGSWKHFDKYYLDFALDSRNVRLYSAPMVLPLSGCQLDHILYGWLWSHLTISPWMCMKTQFIWLTILIPGLTNSKNIDLYMQHVVDDLLAFWNDGVNTYDSFNKQHLCMCSALMWSIGVHIVWRTPRRFG